MDTSFQDLVCGHWLVSIGLCVAIATILVTVLGDVINTHVTGLPPGPLPLPGIGGLYKLSPTQPHLKLENLIQTYGKVLSVNFGFLGPAVFIADPDLPYKALYNKIADRPPLPVFKYLNGEEEGIGSMEYSSKHRQLTMLCQKSIANLSKQTLHERADKAFSLFISLVQSYEGQLFDPAEGLSKMITALMSSHLYGIEYETLDDAILKQMKWNQNVTYSVVNPAHPFNVFSWTINIPCKWSKQLKSAVQNRNNLLREQYNKAESIKHGLADSDSSDQEKHCQYVADSVLAGMVQLREALDETSRPGSEAVKMSCWTLDVAGVSVTTNALQWLVVYLARHSEVQRRAYHHITRLCEDSPYTSITTAQRSQLPYIEAVIYEVLRMSPPIPLSLPRTSLHNNVDINQYHLPKGTMVFTDIWHMHHNEQYWPNADTFKPERFLDASTGQCISLGKLPYYMPFGQGRRSCLGMSLAKDIMFLFACKLIQNMDIVKMTPNDLDLKGRVTLGLEPFPYQVSMIPRRGNNS